MRNSFFPTCCFANYVEKSHVFFYPISNHNLHQRYSGPMLEFKTEVATCFRKRSSDGARGIKNLKIARGQEVIFQNPVGDTHPRHLALVLTQASPGTYCHPSLSSVEGVLV